MPRQSRPIPPGAGLAGAVPLQPRRVSGWGGEHDDGPDDGGPVTFVRFFLAAMIALIWPTRLPRSSPSAVLMAELQEAKDWYYKGRLLCIDDQEPCEECQKSGGTAKTPAPSGRWPSDEKHFDGDGSSSISCWRPTPWSIISERSSSTSTEQNPLQDPALYDDPPFLSTAGAGGLDWGSVTIHELHPNLLDDPATTADQIGEHRIARPRFLDRLLGACSHP